MAENLYCPRCAKPFSTDTSYCRTCGLELNGVAEIVSGDAKNAPVVTRRPNFGAMRIGLGLFIFGLVIGLLNGILKDFNLFPERYGKMVFLGFIIMALVTMGSAFIFPTKKYTKRKTSEPSSGPKKKFQTAPLAGQLPEGDQSPINFPKKEREPLMAEHASVTEHTTRNLE